MSLFFALVLIGLPLIAVFVDFASAGDWRPAYHASKPGPDAARLSSACPVMAVLAGKLAASRSD